MSGNSPPFAARRRPHLYYSLTKRLLKLSSAPKDVSRLGADWRLYPRDWIDNRLLARQPFEFSQLNFAFELIDNYALDLFLDCGANIGLYSVLIGVHAERIGEIHAFEPVPETYARLKTNISLNSLEAKTHCHNLALSDKNSEAEIAFTPTSSGVATLESAFGEQAKRRFRKNLRIETVRFDDQLSFTGRRAFVKIDVEGHALALLRGMTEFLRRNETVLQIEQTPDDDDIMRLLQDLGYKKFAALDPDFYVTNIAAG